MAVEKTVHSGGFGIFYPPQRAHVYIKFQSFTKYVTMDMCKIPTHTLTRLLQSHMNLHEIFYGVWHFEEFSNLPSLVEETAPGQAKHIGHIDDPTNL